MKNIITCLLLLTVCGCAQVKENLTKEDCLRVLEFISQGVCYSQPTE